MICAYLCTIARNALVKELGDDVSVHIGNPPVSPEKGNIYLNVSKVAYNRKTFSSDAEDKTQRITVYLNVVYYPKKLIVSSGGRSDIFKTLGTVNIGSTEYKITSYTAVTNHEHYDITIGYSLPISYFGVSE